MGEQPRATAGSQTAASLLSVQGSPCSHRGDYSEKRDGGRERERERKVRESGGEEQPSLSLARVSGEYKVFQQ